MTTSFATSLDALTGWRTVLGQRLAEAARFLDDHELVDSATTAQVLSLIHI